MTGGQQCRTAGPKPSAGSLAVDAAGAARLCGLSRSKWFELESAGKVPRALRFAGDRCPRWVVSELHEWLRAGAPPRDQWEATTTERLRQFTKETA